MQILCGIFPCKICQIAFHRSIHVYIAMTQLLLKHHNGRVWFFSSHNRSHILCCKNAKLFPADALLNIFILWCGRIRQIIGGLMCSACPLNRIMTHGYIISTSREAFLHKQLPNKALFMGQLTPTAPLGPAGILSGL